MKYRNTRIASRALRARPKRRRVAARPPARRGALLAGTALATGILAGLAVLVATPKPASASPVCDDSVTTNTFICEGSSTAQETVNPTGTFDVQIGPDLGNPFELDYILNNAAAFIINADGQGGTIRVFGNSYINHTETEDGVGMVLNSAGQVAITVDAGGSITGTIGLQINNNSLGGVVTINVDGHVGGDTFNAIEAFGGGSININNSSYASSLGQTNGDYLHDVDLVNVNNGAGLTAGLTGDGFVIANISGAGGQLGGDAVFISNASDDEGDGGVVFGYIDGIDINNVYGNAETGGTDVTILNNGRREWNESTESWDFFGGGLIVGRTGEGILVSESGGDLFIDNSLTRIGSIDLDQLDAQVYYSGTESGVLYGVLPGHTSNGYTNGIYGGVDGVAFGWIGGSAMVRNLNGQIVGASEDGVSFGFIYGSVLIDNSGDGDGGILSPITGVPIPDEDEVFDRGGTIWGGDNGIRGVAVGWNEGEGIFVNNSSLGSTFGVNNGIWLSEAGEIQIANIGGRIEGFYGNGINAYGADKVGIYNGGWWNEANETWNEGRILAGDTAISASADKVGVLNLPGGLIVGDGAYDQPVTWFDTWQGLETEGDGGSAIVFNAGIMTSDRNPHVERTWGTPEINEVPEYSINAEQILGDLFDIAMFAKSAGTMGAISGLGSANDLSINDYWATSSDLLITSEGGALIAFNMNLGASDLGLEGEEADFLDWYRDEGVMFGRIVATGASYTTNESDDVILQGNVLINTGTWFTTNLGWSEDGPSQPYDGNVLWSEGHDAYYNFGFVQTAFGSEGGDYTTFVGDEFNNGSAGLVEPLQDGDFELVGPTGGTGWLSMTDGSADDEVYVYGNFVGGLGLTETSYLALDADLATAGSSDVLEVGALYGGGGIFGSTAVVVNDLSPDSIDVEIGTAIMFARAEYADQSCAFGAWCQKGDAFYLSDLNPNYISLSGIGFVRDGMYVWGVKQDPGLFALGCIDDCEDDSFYFVSDWGPDAYQQPTLTSAAQAAWYDTGGVVEDNLYGNTYPGMGAGGSGADLSYDAPMMPVPAPAAGGQRGALWGKIAGNWANQDAEVIVDDGINTLTYDTGYNQNTYSMLGGLEFRPNSGESGTRFGLFGGYLSSSVAYDDYGASAKLTGPTVGAYAAIANGGWYADAEVKGDFLSVEYTSPSVEAKTKGTSVGILANTGYRIESGGSFFEPIVSAAFVSTHLDDTTGGGAEISYSNGQSIRAGAGARTGLTVVNASGTSAEVDLMAKLWNEFGAANTVTVSDGLMSETFTDGISGVFGEFVGRVTVYSDSRSSSGFVSVGAKLGHDWTSLSAKAGVRQAF